MLASARHLEALPQGHPCQGCEVRDKAVCGILDCTSLEQFRNLGWTLRLSSGQALFHEGDPATRVFTLTSGTLKLYKLLADGRRQVTGFLHPGDFLGISIDDEHAFSAEALEHSQLCWFPRARFDDFVDDHSAMERELYRMAAHELAAAQQQFVLLGRKTATETRDFPAPPLRKGAVERTSGRNGPAPDEPVRHCRLPRPHQGDGEPRHLCPEARPGRPS